MAEQVSFEEWWGAKHLMFTERLYGSIHARDAWMYQQLIIDAQAKQIAELEAEVKSLNVSIDSLIEYPE